MRGQGSTCRKDARGEGIEGMEEGGEREAYSSQGHQVRARVQLREQSAAINSSFVPTHPQSPPPFQIRGAVTSPFCLFRGAVNPPFVLSGITPFISSRLFSSRGSIVNNLSDLKDRELYSGRHFEHMEADTLLRTQLFFVASQS